MGRETSMSTMALCNALKFVSTDVLIDGSLLFNGLYCIIQIDMCLLMEPQLTRTVMQMAHMILLRNENSGKMKRIDLVKEQDSAYPIEVFVQRRGHS